MRRNFSLLFVPIFIVFVILKSPGNAWETFQTKIVKNSAKGAWEGRKSIFLKEELSIGIGEGERNLIFTEPMDVEVDKEGNIYILDKGKFCIQKFDKNGKYLLTIGKKGQGPGEILDSVNIALDSKGNLLVFDYQNSRVSKFDPNGSFLTSFKLEFPAMHGALDSKDNVYLYGRWKGKLIHKYSSDGNYLFSFMDEIPFEPKRIEPHINMLGYIKIHKDKIYLQMIYPYTLYIFDENGKLLEKIITNVPYSKPPFLSPEGMVITNFIITGLAVSPQDYIFIKALHFDVPSKWKERIQEIMANLYKNSFLDLFDSKGKYLLHHKTPDFAWGMTFDSEGYLYMIKQEEDYWRVVKYKVDFK